MKFAINLVALFALLFVVEIIAGPTRKLSNGYGHVGQYGVRLLDGSSLPKPQQFFIALGRGNNEVLIPVNITDFVANDAPVQINDDNDDEETDEDEVDDGEDDNMNEDDIDANDNEDDDDDDDDDNEDEVDNVHGIGSIDLGTNDIKNNLLTKTIAENFGGQYLVPQSLHLIEETHSLVPDSNLIAQPENSGPSVSDGMGRQVIIRRGNGGRRRRRGGMRRRGGGRRRRRGGGRRRVRRPGRRRRRRRGPARRPFGGMRRRRRGGGRRRFGGGRRRFGGRRRRRFGGRRGGNRRRRGNFRRRRIGPRRVVTAFRV